MHPPETNTNGGNGSVRKTMIILYVNNNAPLFLWVICNVFRSHASSVTSAALGSCHLIGLLGFLVCRTLRSSDQLKTCLNRLWTALRSRFLVSSGVLVWPSTQQLLSYAFGKKNQLISYFIWKNIILQRSFYLCFDIAFCCEDTVLKK